MGNIQKRGREERGGGFPFLPLNQSRRQAGWHSHGVHLCGLLLHAHLGAVCRSHLLCHMAGEWPCAHWNRTETKMGACRASTLRPTQADQHTFLHTVVQH